MQACVSLHTGKYATAWHNEADTGIGLTPD